MLRRILIVQLCLVALFVVAPSRGRADDYPSRPIHLIVTSPAGSLVDVIGRLVAQGLGERLGQPVVVDNRPGAMTQLGTDVLVHADPDGYTLMIGPSELAILPFEKKGYPYDPTKDITPIALMTTSWTMFAIYPKLPPQTLPEFIAYAKANPGKLHYGTNGVGGALHLAVEMLKLKTGID
ncbi:MAG: tripartite tricarboxylate transporter substrate-binding protein, partial [Xanthobacteraceae bacterium]